MAVAAEVVMSKKPQPYVDRGRPGLRYDGDRLPRVREPEAPPHTPLTVESLREHAEPELSDADAALSHWAAWAKSSLSGIGWPEKTLLARIIEFGVLGAAQRGSGTLLVVGSMVAYDELCAWVEAAVMRLTLTERNVVVRAYLHYETPEASARQLGMTASNFRQVLYRARRSVRDYLDGRKAAVVL
jgi:hypothetical protein